MEDTLNVLVNRVVSQEDRGRKSPALHAEVLETFELKQAEKAKVKTMPGVLCEMVVELGLAEKAGKKLEHRWHAMPLPGLQRVSLRTGKMVSTGEHLSDSRLDF